MRDHPDDRSGQGWGAGVARPEVTTLLLLEVTRLLLLVPVAEWTVVVHNRCRVRRTGTWRR